LVYSKNNDYIYLFSKKSNSIEGILPVDSKPDQIVISEKLNRAYVLHRVIGQISLIDLSPDSNTQYSVIARITDERLKDPSNVMIIEGTKVFVKSDVSQEGYIDSDNILRYTGPVVEIPLNKNKMIFEPSVISNKRFSLKSGQLFVESITEPNENFSRKIKLIQFGNNLGGLAMKKDGKFFYLSDYSQNKLLVVDSFSEKVVASANTGINPSSVMLDDKNIYVLNQGDNSISSFELDTLKPIKTTKLKVENNSLNMIKIYDRDFEQIIKVNLPPETKKELIIARLEN
ncbi:MAG: YncE family protein, partial [Candidatus Sericytochromatia bacterium]